MKGNLIMRVVKNVITAVALFGLAAIANAQTPQGLGDLIGARGSSVESELERRGYTFAGNLGSAVLWWNARTNTCASVAVDQGRVQSIQTATPADCGHSNSSRHSASSGHTAHTNVQSLVGADAIHAIDVLSEWGFRSVDTISTDDYLYSTYWKPSTHECVQVTTDSRRVTSVDKVDHHPRCR
jgi:hypothetical protein